MSSALTVPWSLLLMSSAQMIKPDMSPQETSSQWTQGLFQ